MASVGAPVQGGQVVIGQDLDPVHLEVQKGVTVQSAEATENVYDSLTVFDENMQIQPSLAENWDTPDPQTYVFHLRKGVKWHNGREFVADDVVYWYNRIMDPQIGASQRGNWEVVKAIDVLDPYTARFNLSRPFADLLAQFATMRESAFPNKETVEQYGDLSTHACGTGPYQVAEFQPGNFIRYTRFADYWGNKPNLDEIVLKIMVNEQDRIAALRTGQIHLGALSPIGATTLANDRSVSVRSAPLALLRMVLINTQVKPYTDVRVRKALSMAIDRKDVIAKVMLGKAVLTGPTPTGHGDWYLPEEQLPAYFKTPDIQGAKQLLTEAGYPNGFQTTIKTANSPAELAAIAVALKNQLQAIGVTANILQLDPTTLAGLHIVGGPAEQISDYELNVSSFTFYPGPDTYIGNFLPERNAIIRGKDEGMRNPQITDWLNQAEATQDHAQRQKLYSQAQLALIDMAPALWLYAQSQNDGIANNLQGYQQSFTGRRYLIRNAWLSKS
jgi:peptide/nickel transport system substrate-binding protein